MENCAARQRHVIARLLFTMGAIIFLLLSQCVQADDAGAELVQLQLNPKRCVALHQGQVCYQSIRLSWSANQIGNYCVYQQNTEESLHCWQNVAVGQYIYEFASDTSVQLQLVNMQTKRVVAAAALEVAWVYKANTRRKTHWRLF